MLPGVQMPKPLSGRGDGKKNLDLFASTYFLAHKHRHGLTKPYELLRPAKQAALPTATPAMRNVLAMDSADTSQALDLGSRQNQPLREPAPVLSSPAMAQTQMDQDLLRDNNIDTHTDPSWTDSSFMEIFSSSESWESRPQRRARQPMYPSPGRRPGSTPVRRPRARANTASGNPACRKYRKRSERKRHGGSSMIGVKRKRTGLPTAATKSRRRMALQVGTPPCGVSKTPACGSYSFRADAYV